MFCHNVTLEIHIFTSIYWVSKENECRRNAFWAPFDVLNMNVSMNIVVQPPLSGSKEVF